MVVVKIKIKLLYDLSKQRAEKVSGVSHISLFESSVYTHCDSKRNAESGVPSTCTV